MATPFFLVGFCRTGHSTSHDRSSLEGGIHSSSRWFMSAGLAGTNLVIFLIVYIEMGFALFDLDRENLCLSQVAVFEGISFAANSQIMNGRDGGVWCPVARVWSARPSAVGGVICHN